MPDAEEPEASGAPQLEFIEEQENGEGVPVQAGRQRGAVVRSGVDAGGEPPAAGEAGYRFALVGHGVAGGAAGYPIGGAGPQHRIDQSEIRRPSMKRSKPAWSRPKRAINMGLAANGKMQSETRFTTNWPSRRILASVSLSTPPRAAMPMQSSGGSGETTLKKEKGAALWRPSA